MIHNFFLRKLSFQRIFKYSTLPAIYNHLLYLMVIKLLFQYRLRPKSSNGCQTLKRCIEMLEHRTSSCNTAQHSHKSVAGLYMNHHGKIIHEPILPHTMPEQQLNWYSITQMTLTLHDKTKWGMPLHHITQRDITSHYITLHCTRSHYMI
jgi:hypothetical protein